MEIHMWSALCCISNGNYTSMLRNVFVSLQPNFTPKRVNYFNDADVCCYDPRFIIFQLFPLSVEATTFDSAVALQPSHMSCHFFITWKQSLWFQIAISHSLYTLAAFIFYSMCCWWYEKCDVTFAGWCLEKQLFIHRRNHGTKTSRLEFAKVLTSNRFFHFTSSVC